MPLPCPTESELAALLEGRLCPDECGAIERHLETCAACRTRLNELSGEGPAEAGEEAADRSRIHSLMAKLKAGAPVVSTTAAVGCTGERIGRYKLLQQLGEGGMGEVWMAEQTEPVRRRVALKIIKAGMDTREVVARFEVERQALAMMDHPNIAKVFDGGSTENGRPFFVMELVRGVRITDYCDQNHLSAVERLHLFIPICQAVQHAHQKGIIHRDLKPSNLLVTINDGVPVPKVIDFGIAKATQTPLTDKTLFTRFQALIGTPVYMSPEQAELTSLDVDTRSDIYSLGVLLYELLTGTTPFHHDDLCKAGIDGVSRMLRDVEPPRPSTRLGTLKGVELTRIAKARRTDAPKLIDVLRGDLDWIVMKCLEKDRTRRYETAGALMNDVQRHIGNEPVHARPPSAAYRFRKLLRRRKGPVIAAASVLLALLLGLAGTTAMFWRERKAREDADGARTEQLRLTNRANVLGDDLKNHLREAAASAFSDADRVFMESLVEPGRPGAMGSPRPDSPEKVREWRHGLLLLARALRFDPDHHAAVERFGNELTVNHRLVPVSPCGRFAFPGESVTISRDGRMVLSESGNQIRVKDLSGTVTLLTLERPAALPRDEAAAGFSPDGRWLVASVSRGRDAIPQTQIWQLPQAELVTVLDGPPLVSPLFSADGNRLAGMVSEPADSGTPVRRVAVYDRESGRLLRRTDGQQSLSWFRFGDNGRCVVTKSATAPALEFWTVDSTDPPVSRDGVWAELSPVADRALYRNELKRLVFDDTENLAKAERRLAMLKAEQVRQEANPESYNSNETRGLQQEIRSVQFTIRSRQESVQRHREGGGPERTVGVLHFTRASTGEELKEVTGRAGWFAPQKSVFVLDASPAAILDATVGDQVSELQWPASKIAFDEKAEYVLTWGPPRPGAKEQEACLWDRARTRLLATMPVLAGTVSAVVNPSADGGLKVLFVSREADGAAVVEHRFGSSAPAAVPVASAPATPDHGTDYSEAYLIEVTPDGSVQVEDWAARKILGSVHPPLASRAIIPANGSRLFTLDLTGMLRTWSLTTFKLTGETRLQGYHGFPGELACSPDGSRLAVCSWIVRQISVWNAVTGERIAVIGIDHLAPTDKPSFGGPHGGSLTIQTHLGMLHFELGLAALLATTAAGERSDFLKACAAAATGCRLSESGDMIPLELPMFLDAVAALWIEARGEGVKAEFARLLLQRLQPADGPEARQRIMRDADWLLEPGNEAMVNRVLAGFPDHPLAEVVRGTLHPVPAASSAAIARALEQLPPDPDVRTRAAAKIKDHLAEKRLHMAALHANSAPVSGSTNQPLVDAAKHLADVVAALQKLTPDDSDLTRWRLRALALGGAGPEVRDGWQQWIAGGHKSKDDYSEAGYWLTCAGFPADADAMFADGLRHFPDSSTLLRWQGFAHLLTGHPDRAEACFRRAIQSIAARPSLTPEPRLLAGLAIACWKNGMKDEAVAEAAKLLEAWPDWKSAAAVRNEVTPPMNSTDVLIEVVAETLRRGGHSLFRKKHFD